MLTSDSGRRAPMPTDFVADTFQERHDDAADRATLAVRQAHDEANAQGFTLGKALGFVAIVCSGTAVVGAIWGAMT